MTVGSLKACPECGHEHAESVRCISEIANALAGRKP